MKMTIVTIVIDNNIVIYSLTHTYIITYIYSLFVFFQMDVNVYVQCTLKEVHNYGYITKIKKNYMWFGFTSHEAKQGQLNCRCHLKPWFVHYMGNGAI